MERDKHMNPTKIILWICIALLFLTFILPWILLGFFVLLAWLGIIELEPVTEIIPIIWNVINT